MTQVREGGAGTLIIEGLPPRDVRFVIWTGGKSITGRLFALPEPNPNAFDFFEETGREGVLSLGDERRLRLSALQPDGKFSGAEFLK